MPRDPPADDAQSLSNTPPARRPTNQIGARRSPRHASAQLLRTFWRPACCARERGCGKTCVRPSGAALPRVADGHGESACRIWRREHPCHAEKAAGNTRRACVTRWPRERPRRAAAHSAQRRGAVRSLTRAAPYFAKQVTVQTASLFSYATARCERADKRRWLKNINPWSPPIRHPPPTASSNSARSPPSLATPVSMHCAGVLPALLVAVTSAPLSRSSRAALAAHGL